MYKPLFRTVLGVAMVVGVGMLASSCTDENYDLGNVDGTIAIGGDSLSLPSNNNTAQILLDDILDLDNSECVELDANNYYVFRKGSDDISAANVSVDKIVVTEDASDHYEVAISVPDEFKSLPAGEYEIPFSKDITLPNGSSIHIGFDEAIAIPEQDIEAFNYSGSLPDGIVSLNKVDVSAAIKLEVKFTDAMASILPELKDLKITMPNILEYQDFKSTQPGVMTGNVITFETVQTAQPITIECKVKSIPQVGTSAPAGAKNYVYQADGELALAGSIQIQGSIFKVRTGTGKDLSDCRITSDLTLGSITVTGAEGRFDKDIKLDNVASVEIGTLPDFLNDDEVTLDVYNPQILLELDSKLPISGNMSGVLISKDENGRELKRINVPEFVVKSNDVTKLCLCARFDKTTASADYQRIVVEGLSTLIHKIPKSLTFEVTAAADPAETAYLELGKTYTVKPAASFEAPLMFGEKAQIVYKDSFDDWNKDLADFGLTDNNKVIVKANVTNRIPAYLTVSAYGIDKQGNKIPESRLKVVVSSEIAAAKSETEPAVTPLEIQLLPRDKNVLNDLDGLSYRASGQAASESGKPTIVGEWLNATRHSLSLDNIAVTIVGRVVVNKD